MVVNGEVFVAGDPAHLALQISTQGKERPRKLFLGKPVEEIGLVLPRVAGRFEEVTLRCFVEGRASVMARGETFEGDAGSPGGIGEEAELDQGVAADARVGGPAGEILVAEIAQHEIFIISRTVEQMERDPQVRADLPGRQDILLFVRPVAGAPPGPGRRRLPPELHHDARDVMPLFSQEKGGDRGIDPAAHPDGDVHVLSGPGPVSGRLRLPIR